jgi:hypothetical protein
MVLDLEDPQIRARVSGLPGGRTRLVLEYPTERYRDTVLAALSHMLRPAPPTPRRPRGRPRKQEAQP